AACGRGAWAKRVFVLPNPLGMTWPVLAQNAVYSAYPSESGRLADEEDSRFKLACRGLTFRDEPLEHFLADPVCVLLCLNAGSLARIGNTKPLSTRHGPGRRA